jgi:hypothetical protein
MKDLQQAILGILAIRRVADWQCFHGFGGRNNAPGDGAEPDFPSQSDYASARIYPLEYTHTLAR